MNYGTCEMIGSPLFAGLKSTFFFIGGFSLLIVPALVITHILLSRKIGSATNSPIFVLLGFVYYILGVSVSVFTVGIFLIPIMGPLFIILYWLPTLIIGLLPLCVYLWVARTRRYGSSEITVQRGISTMFIVAVCIVGLGGFVIEPTIRLLLQEQVFGAYKPSISYNPGGFSKEECFDRGGRSYGVVEEGEGVWYFPDGTSKIYPRR